MTGIVALAGRASGFWIARTKYDSQRFQHWDHILSLSLPTMALRLPPSLAPLQMVAHQFVSAAPMIQAKSALLFAQHLYKPLPSLLSTALPSAFALKLPSILSGIWESILRAVPKKKTSHRKKRQRFMAGKALKDVTSLNKCSACGNVKRAHLLCPYCVRGMRSCRLPLRVWR